jgi:hypothetical protein
MRGPGVRYETTEAIIARWDEDIDSWIRLDEPPPKPEPPDDFNA